MINTIQHALFPARQSASFGAAILRQRVPLLAGFLILSAAQGAHAQGKAEGPVIPPPVVVGVNCLSEQQELELTLLRDKRDQLKRKAQETRNSINEMNERQDRLLSKIRHLVGVISGRQELTPDEEANQINPAEELKDAFEESLQIKLDIAKEEQDFANTVNEIMALVPKIEKLEKLEKCPPPGTATGPGGSSTTVATPLPDGWLPRTAVFWDDSISVIWEYKDGTQYIADYFPDGKSHWTYKGDLPDYPIAVPPPKPGTMAGRPLDFKTPSKTGQDAKNPDTAGPSTGPKTATGPGTPIGGDPKNPTNPYPPNEPKSTLGPSTPIGGDPKNPTNPYPPNEPKSATGPTTPIGGDPKNPTNPYPPNEPKSTLGPTTPIGGDPKNPTNPYPPNEPKSATGPTTPIGGDPKNPTNPYASNEPKSALGPTAPLGGSAAGWIRVQGKDGKWFWVLPTASAVLPADPDKNALGPTAPLGGSAAGWERYQGADGKGYWIMTATTTMLPAEAPPDGKAATGPAGKPKTGKSVEKKPKGRKQAGRQEPTGSRATSDDVGQAIGTGIAIGIAVGGMRHGTRGGGMSSSGTSSSGMSSAGSGPQPVRTQSSTAGKPVTGGSVAKPAMGSSGSTINTTVGKPTIKGFGF